MKTKVWQMFILGCDNLDIALSKGLGGVIFFTKDIKSEKQFISLISDIKSKSLIPPFLSIDQEGGRVERTDNIRARRLSPKFAFEKGEEFLRNQSNLLSKELNKWGLNLNFAPCADVNTNPNNPIIGERAFANNPNDVIKGMNIFIEETRKNKIIPCIKHFPGHGDAENDSHHMLPQINLSIDEMEKYHIKPFKYAIKKDIEMIMVAHLHCTCFDKEPIPTSLSYNAINYLRNNLNYNGVIISDDMVMKGVAQYGLLEAIIKGINVGLDMFIIRNSNAETLFIIEELCKLVEQDKNLQEKVLNSNRRIKKLKTQYLY